MFLSPFSVAFRFWGSVYLVHKNSLQTISQDKMKIEIWDKFFFFVFFFFILQHSICYLLGLSRCSVSISNITKTSPFKYTENFTTREKNENFQIKNSDIFHISAQNIDCGYLLEPPRRGGSNEYP